MIIKRVAQKLGQIYALYAEATPALPLVLDSLRLQKADYEAHHSASDLSFRLHPKCGDWFTFFECCIRQDYFPESLKIEPGDQILDIGGNFGAFALMAARKVGPEGIVHCYEPSPVNTERIRSHTKRNGLQNIHIMECAVGGKAGEISLYTHEKSALSTTKVEVDGRSSSALKAIKVRQMSISDVLSALPGCVAFAKIDCEGAEYDIMERIDPSDLSRIRMIAIETHRVPGRQRHELLTKLIKNGFDIRDGNPLFAVNTSLLRRK